MHNGVIVVFKQSSLLIVIDPPPFEDDIDCGGFTVLGMIAPSEDTCSSIIHESSGVVSQCSNFTICSSALSLTMEPLVKVEFHCFLINEANHWLFGEDGYSK